MSHASDSIGNNAIYLPYGAYELKATYQRNLSLAMLVTVTFVGLLLLIGWLLQGEPPVMIPIPIDRTGFHGKPTVFERPEPLPPTGAGGRPKPQIDSYSSIPNPIPDEEFDPTTSDGVIMSRSDRWGIVEDDGGPGELGGTGQGSGGYIDTTDVLPGPEDFKHVEQQPELIHSVQPDYPRLAKDAEFEGRVVIKALVGKTGEVLDAMVYVSSGHPLLDEAALAVARDYKYRPAIQNHRPVAIWVTYNVDFKLD